MSRKKSLTILNTDIFYNCELETTEQIKGYIKVSPLNEDTIQKEMDNLEAKSRRLPLKDSNHYLIYHEKYLNDKLVESIIKHGGGVSYYTDSVAPYYVINQLSLHTNSEIIYTLRDKFTPKEIKNVELASMATRVVVDCPIVVPNINPYDVLFSLHSLKVHVDKVQFSFPRLHEKELTKANLPYYDKDAEGLYNLKAEIRFRYFKYIQTSLSIWKMYIILLCEDDTIYTELEKIISKDLDRRNPSRKKKRKEQEDLLKEQEEQKECE